MENEKLPKTDSSIDVFGFGKTASSVPPEVYVEATRGFIDIFNKVISPITETTTGIGRYIKQKFDNMTDIEKALGSFTVYKAIEKAKMKGEIKEPIHIKSFINSFEEASKETDKTLNEMWQNILASQLIHSNFHPRYVNILSNFSIQEADLLMKLNTFDNIGKDISYYMGSTVDSFKYFVLKNYDKELIKWSYSCNILREYSLAEVAAPHDDIYDREDAVTILYLTDMGNQFLNTVTLK